MSQRTLADLGVHQEGKIHAVIGTDTLAHRLAEIGFTPGQTVRIIRFAPLGDPMQIRLRGFSIALRRSEAQRILVQPT